MVSTVILNYPLSTLNIQNGMVQALIGTYHTGL